MSSTKPFVAVDCDTLLYSSSAAVDNRFIEVLHSPSGKSKVFKNRTEFKTLMKEKDKPVTNDYVIKDDRAPEEVSHALKLVKTGAEMILDNFSGFEVKFCAGDSDNFRLSLPYPKKYKGNRDDTIRPLHLKAAHEYFKNKYKAVKAYGHECDDEVALLAYEALQQGREAYILSPDGDSRQFDGIKLGKYHSTPQDCIHIDFMPAVSWGKDYDSYGFPWLIMQAAVGDACDGLNPTYLCEKRYGEKSYYNATKDFKEPAEYAKYLVQMYKKWYPDEFSYTAWNGEEVKANWEFMLDLYWKGTTMKRSRDEIPNFLKFLKEKDIEIC